MSSFFKKTKISSKYGYYGLGLFHKEILNGGRIDKNYVILSLEMIKDLFNNELFHPERASYLTACISSI